MSKKYLLIVGVLVAGGAVLLAFKQSPEARNASRHSALTMTSRTSITAKAAPDAARKLPPTPSKAVSQALDTAQTTSDRQPAPPETGGAAQSLARYLDAAEQGDPEAQVQLGLLYEQGQGVEKNLDEASRWFELAAEQGYAPAQANLGDLYEFGDGIRSNKAAAHYYRLAAKQGYLDAQLDLARLYEQGKGLPQDAVQAWLWYSLAARQGDASAISGRDRMSTRMSPAQIAEAERLLRE
jgi:TPR repeat protein